MKCPVCPNVDLVMSERSGIEIDYCPQCRGVWLDRGELDKIIERSIQVEVNGASVSGQPRLQNDGQQGYAMGHHHDHHDRHGHQYSHRKSFWRELFD